MEDFGGRFSMLLIQFWRFFGTFLKDFPGIFLGRIFLDRIFLDRIFFPYHTVVGPAGHAVVAIP